MKTTTLALLTLLVLNINVMIAQSFPKMVKVKGGTFMMGDKYGLEVDDEHPIHKVTLSDYYISKTEVTVAQYRIYCESTGVSMPGEPSWGWNNNDPIVAVNWNDAINYCNWLAEILDKDITLPTEAQWEFAARGGNKSRGYKYSGGEKIGRVGWYSKNSNDKVHRVALKKANELGLYDMTGNAMEWCLDWYDARYYSKSPNKNPKNTRRGKRKVVRGGNWYRNALYCRVAFRYSSKPDNEDRYSNIGFRVVFVK